jgi:hypothetical protein
MAEATAAPLRVHFDRRIKLEFHGARITSGGGLLGYRELDDALGLTEIAITKLLDGRRGNNARHTLAGLVRQPVFGRLAGDEEVNDAERLIDLMREEVERPERLIDINGLALRNIRGGGRQADWGAPRSACGPCRPRGRRLTDRTADEAQGRRRGASAVKALAHPFLASSSSAMRRPSAASALVPVEDGLEPRGLDLTPFQAQGDAVEDEQPVLDPAEPALDPVEPGAKLTAEPVELLVEPAQVGERVALGLRHRISSPRAPR